jgi:hypothetical protein
VKVAPAFRTEDAEQSILLNYELVSKGVYAPALVVFRGDRVQN